ncbi:MAG TPA: arylsulfatase [Stellaceae bacterium]|nr:arylsulfatase [Stellaceae bacterium]
MADNKVPTPGGYPGFAGRIGRTRDESEPHWTPPLRARTGAPNIVIVFMDDMGWADIGCYGSEIATPNIDALAGRGLRFNHYTTHPICSPARAALLTGRNAHSVATGWLANNNPGFPGYFGDIPLDAPTIAETLRAAGYATVMVGKWHNSTNGAAPNQTWPTYRGFDRFYGFLEGETSYFFPARLVYNNIVAPIDEYPPGYYATDDWMDKAIGFLAEIRNQNPAQPFFLYVANNAVHGPLQAKETDLATYRGRYDAGWDAMRAARLERQSALGIVPPGTRLAERDPLVPAWDDLPAEHKALFARHMETYAAMLDCADQNLGRLVAFLERLGELDNTIIVFSSDNGGTNSAGAGGNIHFNRRFAGLPALPTATDVERQGWIGSGRASAVYPMGWAQVSNAPFPSYKTYTGGGGRRVSFIISWPEQLHGGGAIRPHFAHVIDVMPTLLDLAGVDPLDSSHGRPAQKMQGQSFAPVLRDAAAPAPRREQYYECWANRAYYRDGWVAVSLQKRGDAIDFDNWTLHAHSEDFSESIDLRRQHPQKLEELVEAFDRAAWENMVYPLDNRTPTQRYNELPPDRRPPASGRRRFLPGAQTVHRGVVTPLVADRNFTIAVRLRHPAGAAGVLVAIGDVTGGLVIYIEEGRLRLTYNGFGEFCGLAGPSVAAGVHVAALDYQALGGRRGRGRLVLDKVPGEWGDLSPTLMNGMHEGLDIGLDRRAPVDWGLRERHGVFRYAGAIDEVVIESGPFAPDSPYGKG